MKFPALQSRDALATAVAAALLVAAMAFGGGPRGAGDLVVHLMAVPALLLGLWRRRHAEASRLQQLFLYWLLAALAVVALQLLPLPVHWYAALPQRAGVLDDLHAAGLDPAWLPMTLDTWGTVRSLLALASFGALWLLAGTLPAARRVQLLKLAVLLAVPLAMLGFAQAAAGSHAALRFYDYHNNAGATGQFANRNHFACLLAMLVPLAIAFGRAAQQTRQPGLVFVWYGSAVLLFLATMLTFSRAGAALGSAAAAAAVLLALRRDIDGVARRRNLPLLLAAAVAAVAVGNYAWSGITARFDREPLADLRWQYLRYGWDTMQAYLPWGSGLGSFRAAYAPFEPVQAMVHTYAMHAHDDLLEIAVEAGLPGLLLALAAAAWVVVAAGKSLRRDADRTGIMAACALAALVPLLHAFVDYPLRTLAVGAVLALALAHMAAARAGQGTTDEHPGE